MSADEPDESEPGLPAKIYRTVTPRYVGHPDTEMNVIGWALFLGLIVLLVPLLPFLLIVELITRVVDRVVGSGGN